MSTDAAPTNTPRLDDVQWYTPTKRIPQYIGKPPGGGHYPGGPYTVPQVVGGAVVFIIGLKTQGLWGQWNWLINQAVLFSVTIGAVFALRLVKPGGRSPLHAAPAVVLATIGAPHGTHRDQKITLPKPTRVTNGVIHARLEDSPLSHETTALPDPVNPPVPQAESATGGSGAAPSTAQEQRTADTPPTMPAGKDEPVEDTTPATPANEAKDVA